MQYKKRLVLRTQMKKSIVLTILLIGLAISAHSQVKVMSYNVRHCAGMDMVVDYDRTAEVIATQQPDVVALQELDSMTGRSGQYYQLGELASRTQYHPFFASAIDYDGGKYGVGILTREHPLSVKRIPLPGEEPRVLLVVETKDFVLACMHLDLEEEARLASVPLIVEEAQRWQKPFILAGDWNDTLGSPLLQAMTKNFTLLSGNVPTYPSDQPQECIDHIAVFNTNAVEALESIVIDEPVASDHRPLVVTLSLVYQAIERQLKTYPESTLQDVYKSFYQDRFGPGHMIADTASARQYLMYELSNMTDKSEVYYEPTGNKGRFVRVYLSAVADGLITADQLLDAFVRSANGVQKTEIDWETEWHHIEEIIVKNDIQINGFEADAALLREASRQNQAVHHSRAYNAAYHPHYRIVERSIFEKELKHLIKSK